ncbi:MAG: hypothetical protein U0Z44_07065 [Kouleothrix sp.]
MLLVAHCAQGPIRTLALSVEAAKLVLKLGDPPCQGVLLVAHCAQLALDRAQALLAVHALDRL